MPCSVSAEEEAAYRKIYEDRCKEAGRWDLIATREQLAGWLCDAMRGDTPTPEASRWFTAHQEFHDAPLRY